MPLKNALAHSSIKTLDILLKDFEEEIGELFG